MIGLLNEVSGIIDEAASGVLGDVAGNEAAMTVPERLLTGVKYFAIGLITVFIVLFLIIVVIKVVSILIDKVKIKKKVKSAPQTEVNDEVDLVEVDDGEEIAAVMAAITAYMSTETALVPTVGFKVRSIKTIINK